MSAARVRVVVFTGGRGSVVLSSQLLADPRIELTLAINGYDDGASTGEVRRFLGDCLGPSDYRKNASRLAGQLGTCSPELIALLDHRLPVDCDAEQGMTAVRAAAGLDASGSALVPGLEQLRAVERRGLADRLASFLDELERSDRTFDFRDCAVGNLVFAGSFLRAGRRFNDGVADYCDLLSLPRDVIINVTDGRDLHLVAVTREGKLLATEAEIVGAAGNTRIHDIHLLPQPLDDATRDRLNGMSATARDAWLADHEVEPVANPLLLERIERADVIVYSPGTQHSSLFPTYLTPGVGEAIACNLDAIKLLITNIHVDAEIMDASAVDLVHRAVFYLRRKDRLALPTPALITHFLLNDPASTASARPYVPLGAVDSFEDPRLVRIGNYEAAEGGRHNARRVLVPFLTSYLDRPPPPSIAVVLLGTESADKVLQTMLEMTRGGVARLETTPTVFHFAASPLNEDVVRRLPFPIVGLHDAHDGLAARVLDGSFEYVLLFESSGMYRGEEIVQVAAQLASGRLDAVWGSRRLSVRDIQESYKLRYERRPLIGAVSYVGSHLLSLLYLLFYGRYISDTLSGARAVRARLIPADLDLDSAATNHRLLAAVLGRRGELIEIPVQFFPITPEKVRRTTVLDGLKSLAWIVRARIHNGPAPRRPAPPGEVAEREPEVAAGRA